MIDYAKITDAIDFYKRLGYAPYDLPWTANLDAIKVTIPPDFHATNSDIGYLIGSAEQGFLDCVANKGLKGMFQATTPCFRDEKEDRIHRKYFIKTELFINAPGLVNLETLDTMLGDAIRFFQQYTHTTFKQTGAESYDVLDHKTGIELGSYGIGRHPKYGEWLYGTGVAEPRLSNVLSISSEI